MKRTDLDRGEIEQALKAEPNITDAAKSLGVARRTLQNRMRSLGMPVGRSGRPTRKLTYSKRRRSYAGWGAAAAALVGGVLVGRHFTKSKA